MSFRLVSNSVTLDDRERRNSPYRRVISPNSVAFDTDCGLHQYIPQRKCRPQNLSISGGIYGRVYCIL